MLSARSNVRGLHGTTKISPPRLFKFVSSPGPLAALVTGMEIQQYYRTDLTRPVTRRDISKDSPNTKTKRERNS